MKYFALHVTKYQHLSIAFAIIIGVAVQEYKRNNGCPWA
jgi:hypothetical protein